MLLRGVLRWLCPAGGFRFTAGLLLLRALLRGLGPLHCFSLEAGFLLRCPLACGFPGGRC
jgi:hypothetical protein